MKTLALLSVLACTNPTQSAPLDFIVAGCSIYGNCITVDASLKTFTSYSWNWGDGTERITTSPIADHYYKRDSADYLIRLEARDASGRIAVASRSVVAVGTRRWLSP